MTISEAKVVQAVVGEFLPTRSDPFGRVGNRRRHNFSLYLAGGGPSCAVYNPPVSGAPYPDLTGNKLWQAVEIT